jgi:hypothetical protein
MFVILPSPILELQHTPLPTKMLPAREHAPTLDFSAIFTLDSHLSLSKSLGARHQGSSTLLLKMLGVFPKKN